LEARHFEMDTRNRTLMDGGAEVNAQGGGYGTALQVASRGGHEKVVQMLLSAGAEDGSNALGDPMDFERDGQAPAQSNHF
jgi:hypothetical protein